MFQIIQSIPGFNISNLRITSAAPDMRSKLLKKENDSYGIYFDINKDIVNRNHMVPLRESLMY